MSEWRRRRAARLRDSFDHDRADLTSLALRARDGDRLAETAFIRRTMPDVARFCAHMVGPESADDAAQATYIRALGALHAFRGESSAKTWLIGVSRNVCLDELRSRGRRRRVIDRLESQRVTSSVHDLHGTDADHLADAIRDLDPERREAFVLTQVLGYSYEEAAAVADCPVGTIRSRVSRARGHLVEAIDALEAEDQAIELDLRDRPTAVGRA